MAKPVDVILGAQTPLRDALEQVRPRMAQLDPAKLSTLPRDPFAAATMVRGALPGLLSLRAEILEQLPTFDISNLDLLEVCALALMQAEMDHRVHSNTPDELPFVFTEACDLRKSLLADLEMPVKWGLLPRPRLLKATGPNCHRNVASDLLTLVQLYREAWPTIADATLLLPADLDHVEVVADQLLIAIDTRQRRIAAARTAEDDRRRAFTLLLAAYDEVKSAIAYLRWEVGDVDCIAPPLFQGRNSKHTKSPSRDVLGTGKGPYREESSSDRGDVAEAPTGPHAPRARRNSNDPFLN